jgi:hypothetical protein
MVESIAPGLVSDLLGLINRLLPAPGGIGSERIKGSESYSSLSPSWLTMLGDSAARRYNEVVNGRDDTFTSHSQV